MKLINILCNTETGDTRTTFSLSGDLFVVVKQFGSGSRLRPPPSSMYTVKFWSGSTVDKTQSFWKTNEPVYSYESRHFIFLEAVHILGKIMPGLYSMHRDLNSLIIEENLEYCQQNVT